MLYSIYQIISIDIRKATALYPLNISQPREKDRIKRKPSFGGKISEKLRIASRRISKYILLHPRPYAPAGGGLLWAIVVFLY